MEEEYFLYNNTLYSKGDLSKKYGESVDQKISEFGFEKAYQYNDVVYSSSQLKSKYGDDYESVIETKGITQFGLKKKGQTQLPQEEAITEDSSTVAEPLQESGGEFDIATAQYDSTTDTRLKGKPQFADLTKSDDYKVRKEIFSYTPEKLKAANSEIDSEINSLKEQFEFIRNQDAELNEYAKRINQSILPIQGAGSKAVRERIRKQVLDYETSFSELTEQDKLAKDKYEELIKRKATLEEKSALDEFNKKAEQGNWFGGLYNNFLYGIGELSAGISNDAIDIMVELMPEEMYGGVSKDEAKKQVKENLLPYVRKGIKELVGAEGTTDEYIQRVSEKNIFTEGIYGLARSAPAMISPYMSGMYFQIKDGIRQEIDLIPELNEINEWEKQAVQTPIALSGMFLERFGFSKLAKSTKAATVVAKEALSSLPQNATKKQVVDAISSTAQNMGSKLVSGFAAEAETGALQEISDVGIKSIYNEIKGKDLFATPETVKEFEANVIRAGIAEGIGGFGIAIPTAVSTFVGKGNLGKVTNNEQYELVEQIMSDPDALSAKKKELKAKLDVGKITDEQYDIEINNINAASEIISEIDDTLPTEKRRQAFDLITEKKKIQGELAELETKDQDLVADKVKEKTKQLEEVGLKLQELSSQKPQQEKTTVEQYGDKKEVKISQEQFDEALNILEPIASEGREPTLEELESVYKALGENASDVVDMAAKKDAVDLYNELTDKKKENAKRKEGQPMREQGGQEKAEGTVDSDMSKDDKAELQDGEKVEKEIEKIAKVSGVKAKNIRGLYDINRKMWGLNRVKALAVSVIQDRTIGNQAKRTVVYEENGVEKLGVLDKRQEGGKVRINIGTNANPVYKVVTPKKVGISKEEMYSKIKFKKGDKAPSGALKQESPIWESTAKRGLGSIQQKAATPEQWVKMISDKGGRGTNQELEWIGLNDFLKDYVKENGVKSVPKEVVEQYINDNQIEIVDVTKQETVINVVKGNDGYFILEDDNGNRVRPYDKWLNEDDAQDSANRMMSGDIQTKSLPRFSQYTLEGGENYREVLLTLPSNKKSDQKFYKKEHFDEGNILAHLRINERTLPNGERVMFIEEVQSDWAQEGKKKGFDDKKQDLTPRYRRLDNGIDFWEIGDETQKGEVYFDPDRTDATVYTARAGNRMQDFDNKNDAIKWAQDNIPKQRGVISDMPYKKTDQWVGMAMRRVFKMAVDEGFDRVAWVTGEQSAERYDLSKQIESIYVIGKNQNNDKNKRITLIPTSGETINFDLQDNGEISSGDFKGKTLDEVIGKELADKVLKSDDSKMTQLSGEDLSVGGEGMKAFYNSILPKVAKKEAQRFDKKANVEVVEIEQKKKDDRYEKLIEKKKEFQEKADKSSGFVRDAYLEDAERTQAVIDKEYKILQQLSIAITPEMRMNLNSAVPLFQGEQGAMLAEDGKYIVYALTNPNVSTPLHELAHIYEHYLTDAERKQILSWAGKSKWDTSVSEKFARGFERYLANGKAPDSRLQKIFDKFKEWLTEIYNGIKGSDIDIELNDKMRDIYSKMLKKEETSKSQQPSSGAKKPQEKQSTAKTATAEQKSNQETEEGKEKKIRRFAKSTAQTFTGLKESIESNPENYYTPQEWAKMKDRISDMTDEEVVERMSEVGLNRVKDGNDNNAVLAAIELINRRLADGKSIDDIVERFSKEGTKMGQLIAQFATLNSSTPFGVMSAISKIMEKNDKILSKEQKKRIQDLAKDMLEKNNKLKQFVKEKGGNATTEDINKMKKLRDEAESASREFFNYTSSFTPMSWSDILSMTVQGNLLTPMSQATNVIANVAQQGLMIPVDVGKSLIDVVRGLFGKKRVGSTDPRKYIAGFFGVARGLKESWNVITKGGTDYAKGDVKRSFKPFTAASQALSGTFIGDILGVEQGLIPKTLSKKGKDLLTKARLEESKGNLEEADKLKQQALEQAKVSLDDRLKKFYESFFGVAPEIMFRLLSLGDKPFYYFTQYKNLYVDGKRKGLKGEKLRNFVLMPDAKTLEAVEKESLESVFMEDGAASRTAIHITASVDRSLKGIGKDSYFSKLVGSTLSFIFKTQVPYVKTPTNIISQTIDFAIPPVAVAKAISAYSKGDIKSGDKNIAIATTGFIIGNVAAILISEGLISSPFDFGDDKEDERNVKYDVFPPNHLNISGVQRLIEGKDPSIKAGDTTIDLRKLGILGALVLIRSSQNKRLYKEEKNNAINIQNEVSALDRVSAWAGAPMDVMKYSMEQSFLAGTASLLEALKGGQGSTQRWLTQTSRAVSSVALPNTMSAITRATDSYLYDTRQEETSKMIEALMYDRLGFTGIPQAIGVEYPIRVDMWGNDVDRTPKGRNALYYHLFDVSKAQNVPTNKLSLEVYNLYRNTLNPNSVPNLPKRTFFYEGNKYYIPKTTEGNTLLNEYAKVIGQARKRQAEKEIEKNSYKNASIEERANKMATALTRGTNSLDVTRAKKKLVKELMRIKNK